MPTAQSGFFDWVLFILRTYGPLFLRGAGTTLLLALSGTFVGFIIGLAIGSVRAVPVKKTDGVKYWIHKVVNAILSVYIEVFRSTPMIVQAMVIFYGAAQLFKITMPNLLAGFLIVSINTGAYLSEIVRGGIQSVDPGQREAAQAIGMTYGQTMLHIVLPQAIRNILPALGNEFVTVIKESSIVSVIGIADLMFRTNDVIALSYKSLECLAVAALIYFVLTFISSRLVSLAERKLSHGK